MAAVPTMGWLGGGLLVGLLASLGLRRIRRVSTGLGLLLALAYAPVAEAQTVSVPHTFSNGSVADAGQVNANFAALVAAVQELQGRMFLTTDACPAGCTVVEDGYIKLGSTGQTTTASSRTLSTPGHGHSHSLHSDTYAGHVLGEIDGSVTGTGLAFLDIYPSITDTGAHSHTITGTVGAGPVSGDTPQAITGDLEHITLRLCVPSP